MENTVELVLFGYGNITCVIMMIMFKIDPL